MSFVTLARPALQVRIRCGHVLPSRSISVSVVRLNAAKEKLAPIDDAEPPHLLLPSQRGAYARFSPVLSALPPVDFGIAYGSGVLAQANVDPNSPPPLVDFIVSAPDLESFHAENLARNPDHYPLYARTLGPAFISRLNERWGAGLWYVTMVRVGDLEVKYGVISTSALLSDLCGWDTLYTAGRLQKPVLVLRETPEIGAALSANLKHALAYALLQMPGRFTEFELWEKITGISYSGDPRMSVPGGENPKKIQNIVRGEHVLDGFRALYGAHLARVGLRFADGEKTSTAGRDVAEFLWRGRGEETLLQPDGVEHAARLVCDLPRPLRVKVGQHFGAADVDSAEIWARIANQPNFRNVVENEVKEIIRRPATTQSVKGLVTAGFTKSFWYSLAKIKKYFAGRRKK